MHDEPLTTLEPSSRTSWAARVTGLLPSPASTPFTFWYLTLLLATSVIQNDVGETVSGRLMALSSTDAHNLWHRPVMSMISSALWISDSTWIAYVLIFALAVAPLERRVGPGWTFAVFASGHVLATLATEIPVMVGIHDGWLPKADAHWLDIGVSYGFFASAGAMLLILAPKSRLWAVPLTELSILVIYLTDDSGPLLSLVTLAGHLTALHIGMFGWRSWLRRRGLAGSLRLARPRRRAGRDQARPIAALAGSTAP